ncbi:hypothetical protein ACFLRM_02850 [Acidobacteriota bacterium]
MSNAVKNLLFCVILILAVFSGYFFFHKHIIKNSTKKPDYSCLIEPGQKEYTCLEGERLKIFFKLTNRGKTVWSSQAPARYFLSFHLFKEDGESIQYDNRRFPLPQEVRPAQSTEMTIILRTPLEHGNYILEFDMVREGIAWFKDYGSQVAKIPLLVTARKWKGDKYSLSLEYGKYSKFFSNIDELNKALKLIQLTLKQNEVQFDGKTGKIHGFSAGTNYPQIWLRDANTIIPASRYFYDSTYFISWLEEHLAFQKENGSLEDWIDSRGMSDKNTTETDQETSAVQAAYQIFKILGPEWLRKSILGVRVIERLDKALFFVLTARFHKDQGLVTGAHTADWGDVDMVDFDEKALYVDQHTHWTADIYDQSMFYQACLNLAEMFDSLGQQKKASFWEQKSKSIKKKSNRLLWQENKGFYRIHLHLDSLYHDFNEKDMFALGGNTLAILSLLADNEKIVKIIPKALERQKNFNISTISGTILPPYPKHFFKHPLLDDPYEYQNGAQWDWFGARFVYAMFEHGFSRLAKEKLLEILNKNLSNRSFFEWDNKEGTGLGSDFYCGSAGSLSKAVFEGYFGLKMGKEFLDIEPKIDKDSAEIHVYHPANDTFAAYKYSFDSDKNELNMRYNSNLDFKGKIKILSPWLGLMVNKNKQSEKLRLQRDGKDIDYQIEIKNNDTFLVIETDFNSHVLKIRYLPDLNKSQ